VLGVAAVLRCALRIFNYEYLLVVNLESAKILLVRCSTLKSPLYKAIRVSANATNESQNLVITVSSLLFQ
jgi:hypothetical protein